MPKSLKYVQQAFLNRYFDLDTLFGFGWKQVSLKNLVKKCDIESFNLILWPVRDT